MSAFESRLTIGDRPAPDRRVDDRVRIPGRGGQRQPPGQPGRGRHGPLARAGGGGRGRGRPPATDVEAGDTMMILESMKMETPVKAPVRGPGPGDPGRRSTRRSTAAARCCGSTGSTTGAASAPRRPWSSPPTRRTDGRRPASAGARRSGGDAGAGAWATTCSAGRGAGAAGGLRPGPRPDCRSTTRAARRRRWTCWRPSPTWPSCPGTGRPARRRPATSGCTARASTSTPTCTRWTWSGRVCRRRSAAGWPRALAHYGVTDLEPGPELEEAVYRVFLAQERAADQIPIVTGLLERWRNAVPGLRDGHARGGGRGRRAAGGGHPAALPGGR